MSFAGHNFLSFLIFRSTGADDATGAGSGPSGNRVPEEQALFPTMVEDGKDMPVICFERLYTVRASW